MRSLLRTLVEARANPQGDIASQAHFKTSSHTLDPHEQDFVATH